MMMNSLTRSTRMLHPLHPVIPSFAPPVAVEDDGEETPTTTSPYSSQEEDTSEQVLLTQPTQQQHYHVEDDTIVIHSVDEEDGNDEGPTVKESDNSMEKVQEEDKKVRVEGHMLSKESNTEVINLMEDDDDDDDDDDDGLVARNNNINRTLEDHPQTTMASSVNAGKDNAEAALVASTSRDSIGATARVRKNDKWDFMYQQLLDYKEANDGCTKVPVSIRPLGSWVARQRQMYTGQRLSLERKARLEAVGFVWRVHPYRPKALSSPKRTPAPSTKPPKLASSRPISSWFKPKAVRSPAASTELIAAGSADHNESDPEPTSSPTHCGGQDQQKGTTTTIPSQAERVDNGTLSDGASKSHRRTPAVMIRPAESSTTSTELLLSDDNDDSTIDAVNTISNRYNDKTKNLFARTPGMQKRNMSAQAAVQGNSPPPSVQLKEAPNVVLRKHSTETVSTSVTVSSPTQETPTAATTVAVPYEQQIEQLWEIRFQEFKAHIAREGASTHQIPFPGTLLGWVQHYQEAFRQGNIHPKQAKRLLEAGFSGPLHGTDLTEDTLLEPEERWNESCRKVLLLLSNKNCVPQNLQCWLQLQAVLDEAKLLPSQRLKRLEMIGIHWEGTKQLMSSPLSNKEPATAPVPTEHRNAAGQAKEKENSIHMSNGHSNGATEEEQMQKVTKTPSENKLPQGVHQELLINQSMVAQKRRAFQNATKEQVERSPDRKRQKLAKPTLNTTPLPLKDTAKKPVVVSVEDHHAAKAQGSSCVDIGVNLFAATQPTKPSFVLERHPYDNCDI